jgi:CelD/BcsL family acetyltransferase involved in cellulose biosynthesis
MEFKLIKKFEDLSNFRAQWNRLLENSSDKSITQTWEWLFTWWKIYGEERKLYVIIGSDNNEIVGIAPFSIPKTKTKYFKILNYNTIWFIGSGETIDRNVTSDYLNLLTMGGKEKLFINSLLKWLNDLPFWDEIILENISSESIVPELLKEATENNALNFEITQKAPSILIKLPPTWETFMQAIRPNLRYKIRRGRKEFEKLKGRYHLIQSEKDIPEAFHHLEFLHQHRWRVKGIAGAFSSPKWKAFHRELMPLIFKNGWLRLSFLELDGNVTAANYSFVYDKKMHFFQSGMIPHKNKHVRLGLILHSYCIEEAIKEGDEEYDFLKVGYGDREFKKMWGNYSRDLVNLRISRNNNKEIIYGFFKKIVHFLRSGKNWIESNLE